MFKAGVMGEQAIQDFHAEILSQYPRQCQLADVCGMFALRASQLAGQVAAEILEPHEAIIQARDDSTAYAGCIGQIAMDGTDKAACGRYYA